MTGITEILVLVLLIACILILPRMFKGEEPDKKVSSSKKIKNLSTKLRFKIVLTLAYPVIMALYIKPWENHLILFISYGVAPVILVWAIIWIMAGKKKRQ